jgi:2'-5' RNA ligase
VRAFVGIPLPDAHAEALLGAGEHVRDGDPRWSDQKWVPRQNLHLTLEFLGDISPESATALAEDLHARLAEARPPHLSFEAIVARPRSSRARMLWATYRDENGSLAAIAASVARAAEREGIDVEERRFVAHATLVRARRQIPVEPKVIEAATSSTRSALGESLFMSVRHARLYESTLTRAGAVYETVADIQLGTPR